MSIARRTISLLILGAVLAIGSFSVPAIAFAQNTPADTQTIGEQYDDIADQGIIFAGICDSKEDPCDCRDEGRCTLEDLLQVLVNVSVFILGISGSILLLVFFYGGFMWITAHGNPTMVDNGKKAIIGGVVGLVIVFGSYAAVTLLVKVVQTGEVTQSGENLEDVIEGGETIFETN